MFFFCLNSGFDKILFQKGDILNLLSFVHYFWVLIVLLGNTIDSNGTAHFSLDGPGLFSLLVTMFG